RKILQMMPYEPVLDIMRRTVANLEFVNRHATSEGPFEVTQLINSFLGALAHPWESLKEDLNLISLAEAERQGWPVPDREKQTDKVPASFGELLRYIRNSVAHGNISFLPDGRGQIAIIRIESRNKSGRRVWGALVTPEKMTGFLKQFAALVEALDRNAREPRRIA